MYDHHNQEPWESQNLSEQDREETLAVIRPGLEEMPAGTTRPAREVLAEFRRKSGIPG